MGEYLVRMQSIDRRILYAVLLVIVVAGLLLPKGLGVNVGPQARMLYNAVQSAPTDKIAIVCVNWSASSQGENRPQTRVILTHLMSRHIRFLIMGFDPQSPTLAQEVAEELAPQFGYKYGVNWVNVGYRPQVETTLKSLVQDIPATFKEDAIERKPLSSFPAMAGVKNIRDVGVIVEVSPSGTYKAWVQLVVGTTSAPYCFCPTSVMAPEVFTYLDSGQIKGMLFGIKGAAEYEELLVENGVLKERGFTTRAMTPVSLTLILLFVLIGLGNLGMFAARRAGRRS
jgi:hypothetical protein